MLVEYIASTNLTRCLLRIVRDVVVSELPHPALAKELKVKQEIGRVTSSILEPSKEQNETEL